MKRQRASGQFQRRNKRRRVVGRFLAPGHRHTPSRNGGRQTTASPFRRLAASIQLFNNLAADVMPKLALADVVNFTVHLADKVGGDDNGGR